MRSAFSQAGILGLALYPVRVGLVLAFHKAIGKKVGYSTVVAASAQFVAMVLSTDFIAMFLTHGLLFSPVLLAAIRSLMSRKAKAMAVESHLF